MILKKYTVYITILLIIISCSKEEQKRNFTLKGSIFGTSYKIVYLNASKNYQRSIDSLFFL